MRLAALLVLVVLVAVVAAPATAGVIVDPSYDVIEFVVYEDNVTVVAGYNYVVHYNLTIGPGYPLPGVDIGSLGLGRQIYGIFGFSPPANITNGDIPLTAPRLPGNYTVAVCVVDWSTSPPTVIAYDTFELQVLPRDFTANASITVSWHGVTLDGSELNTTAEPPYPYEPINITVSLAGFGDVPGDAYVEVLGDYGYMSAGIPANSTLSWLYGAREGKLEVAVYSFGGRLAHAEVLIDAEWPAEPPVKPLPGDAGVAVIGWPDKTLLGYVDLSGNFSGFTETSPGVYYISVRGYNITVTVNGLDVEINVSRPDTTDPSGYRYETIMLLAYGRNGVGKPPRFTSPVVSWGWSSGLDSYSEALLLGGDGVPTHATVTFTEYSPTTITTVQVTRGYTGARQAVRVLGALLGVLGILALLYVLIRLTRLRGVIGHEG